MLQTGIIPSAHSDLVTDAAYDFYGQRLATCSLDQRIKVWQVDEASGEWKVEDDWKAHEAAISKISWAHPEFGTIIASCSFDRTVKIWEQLSPGGQTDSAPQQQSQQQSQSGGQPTTHASPRWIERAVLLDARGTVRSVEFAPHRLGLKLATISSDNLLRIYECLEQPSLSTWQITEEVDVSALPSSVSPSIHSRVHTMALATPTQTHATLDAASASLVAQALQQGLQQGNLQNRLGGPALGAGAGTGNREADGGWCISWCKEHYWGEVVAAGCGTNGIVKIIHISPSRRPSIILALDPSPSPSSDHTSSNAPGPSLSTQHQGGDGETHKDKEAPYAITSVAWAPSCGRSYHLIATGGRDGKVRIWKVKPNEEGGGAGAGDLDAYESGEDEMKWSATVVADFDQHKSAVGRVEWNITGTVLSSVGNDGRVRLWKATSGNVWRPAGSIGVEQSAEDDQDNHGHSSRDVDMDS
ncbi:WD40 repeat-like protein [Pluteus cervinus]|uniref:WD40 repeat-like protein n=1 Tax=Pluteus cervinus TaxID=181527 RepID=A0ACD3AFP1_9AGAR|nr:WD40 repeat-like protein [Pluteus cervinus]